MSITHLRFHESAGQIISSIQQRPEEKDRDVNKELSKKIDDLFKSFENLKKEEKKTQAPVLKAVLSKISDAHKLPLSLKIYVKCMEVYCHVMGYFKPKSEAEKSQFSTIQTRLQSSLPLVEHSSYAGQLSNKEANAILEAEPHGAWLIRYDSNLRSMVVSSNQQSRIQHDTIQSTQDLLKFSKTSSVDTKSLRTLLNGQNLAKTLIDQRNTTEGMKILDYAARLQKDIHVPILKALKEYPYNAQLLKGLASYYNAQGLDWESFMPETHASTLKQLYQLEQEKPYYYVGQLSRTQAESILPLPTSSGFTPQRQWLIRVSEKEGFVYSSYDLKTKSMMHTKADSLDALLASKNISKVPAQAIPNASLIRSVTHPDPLDLTKSLVKAFRSSNVQQVQQILIYAAQLNVSISPTLEKALEAFLIEFQPPEEMSQILNLVASRLSPTFLSDLFIKLHEQKQPNTQAIQLIIDFTKDDSVSFRNQLENELKARPTSGTIRSLVTIHPDAIAKIVGELYEGGNVSAAQSLLKAVDPAYHTRLLEKALSRYSINIPRGLLLELADRYEREDNNFTVARSLLMKYQQLGKLSKVEQKNLDQRLAALENGIEYQYLKLLERLNELKVPELETTPFNMVTDSSLDDAEKLAASIYQLPLGHQLMNAIARNENLDSIFDNYPDLQANKEKLVSIMRELTPIARRAFEKLNPPEPLPIQTAY